MRNSGVFSLQSLAKTKRQLRRAQSRLPFLEKIEMVVRLQEIASRIRNSQKTSNRTDQRVFGYLGKPWGMKQPERRP